MLAGSPKFPAGFGWHFGVRMLGGTRFKPSWPANRGPGSTLKSSTSTGTCSCRSSAYAMRHDRRRDAGVDRPRLRAAPAALSTAGSHANCQRSDSRGNEKCIFVATTQNCIQPELPIFGDKNSLDQHTQHSLLSVRVKVSFPGPRAFRGESAVRDWARRFQSLSLHCVRVLLQRRYTVVSDIPLICPICGQSLLFQRMRFLSATLQSFSKHRTIACRRVRMITRTPPVHHSLVGLRPSADAWGSYPCDPVHLQPAASEHRA